MKGSLIPESVGHTVLYITAVAEKVEAPDLSDIHTDRRSRILDLVFNLASVLLLQRSTHSRRDTNIAKQ